MMTAQLSSWSAFVLARIFEWRAKSRNVTAPPRPLASSAWWIWAATAGRSDWVARTAPAAGPLPGVPPDLAAGVVPAWALPTPVPEPTMLGPPFRIPLLAAAGFPNGPSPFRKLSNFALSAWEMPYRAMKNAMSRVTRSP